MWPVDLTKEETYNLDINEHSLNCFTSGFPNYTGKKRSVFIGKMTDDH